MARIDFGYKNRIQGHIPGDARYKMIRDYAGMPNLILDVYMGNKSHLVRNSHGLPLRQQRYAYILVDIVVVLAFLSMTTHADILAYHDELYAFHGRVRDVAPNGDIIVDLGSEAGESLGMTGVVVRTEPLELFVAKVKVKNVVRGEAIIKKTEGNLVRAGDHVFLGERSADVSEPQKPEPNRPGPIQPPPVVTPPVSANPDARYGGTFSGLWDSTMGGTSYRYPRTIVINADLKSGTDTIKQPTGQEATFQITGEVVDGRFVGKNHPPPRRWLGPGRSYDDAGCRREQGEC